MGTNFYYFTGKIKEGIPAETGLHIGKLSAGWVFHFQAYEKLRTIPQYKAFLKEGYIYNEYDEEVSYEDFWRIVEDSLKPDPWDNEPPYSFDNLPEGDNTSSRLTGIEEWMSSGFMFTKNDFC